MADFRHRNCLRTIQIHSVVVGIIRRMNKTFSNLTNCLRWANINARQVVLSVLNAWVFDVNTLSLKGTIGIEIDVEWRVFWWTIVDWTSLETVTFRTDRLSVSSDASWWSVVRGLVSTSGWIGYFENDELFWLGTS